MPYNFEGLTKEPSPTRQYNFEGLSPSKPVDLEESITGVPTVTEDPRGVAPDLGAIPESTTSDIFKPAGKTAKGMLFGEGLPEGLGLLQKPLETAVDYWGERAMGPEEEQSMMAEHPNLMAARYAASSLLFPGIGEKIASPIEMDTFIQKAPEEQRVEIIGLAASYAAFGAATRGATALLGYAANKYPWLTKPIGKILKETNWYRQATIKERGIVVQSVDDLINSGLSEAQILKSLKQSGNTREFTRFKEQAIKKRMGTKDFSKPPGGPSRTIEMPYGPVGVAKKVSPTAEQALRGKLVRAEKAATAPKKPPIAPIPKVKPVKAIPKVTEPEKAPEIAPQEPAIKAKEPWEIQKTKDYEEGRISRIDETDEYRLSSIISKNEPDVEVYKKSNPVLRTNPQLIEIFRATEGKEISPGDWVYLRKDLAEEHIKSRPNAKIISKQVSINDILVASDAVEFVYSPKPAAKAKEPLTVYHAKTKGEFKGGKPSVNIGSDADIMGKGFYIATNKDYITKNYGTPEAYNITGNFATKEQWIETTAKYSNERMEKQRELAREELDQQGYDGILQKSKDGEVGVIWNQDVLDKSIISAKPAVKPAEPVEITGPAEAKEVTVDIPKKEADALSPKEQKAYLLAEIDKAIAEAPEGFFNLDQSKVYKALKKDEKKPDIIKQQKEISKQLREFGTVTIHVPGDGDFTILNSKQSLQDFKKQAGSFPTTIPKPTGIKTAIAKPSGKRMTDIEGEYYNEFKPRKQGLIEQTDKDKGSYYNDGYFSDGVYGVKVGAKPKVKGKLSSGKEAPDIKRLVEDSKGFKPAEFAGEWYTGAGYEKLPFYEPMVHVVAKIGKEELHLAAKYVDSVLTLHPNAKPYIKKGHNGIIFKVDGEPVGLVMSKQIEGLSVWQQERFEKLSGKVQPAKKPDIQFSTKEMKPVVEDNYLLEQAKKYNTLEEFVASVPISSRSEKRKIIKKWKKDAGYKQVDSSFDRGDSIHSPSDPEGGSPLYDLTENGTYPEDVYSFEGLRYYGTGEAAMDRNAYSIISSAEGQPNRIVKVYRAVEKGDPQKILPGDWVTTVRSYAKEHGEGTLKGEYKIVSKSVTAKDIFTSGDSWLEFGYHPQPLIPRKVYTKNKAKLIEIWDRASDTTGATLYSGLDPAAIIDAIKQTKGQYQAAKPYLEEFGRRAYQKSKDFKGWSARMKAYLGDMWDAFKDRMREVWRSVRKPFAGERGILGDKTPEEILRAKLKKSDAKELKNRATQKQMAKIHIIAKEKGWLNKEGKPKQQYRRLAKAFTEKSSVSKMTSAEASDFLNALRKIPDIKIVGGKEKIASLPRGTKLVTPGTFEKDFREPTLIKFITASNRYARTLGVNDFIEPSIQARTAMLNERTEIFRQLDKIRKIVNKKTSIVEIKMARVRNKPTKAETKLWNDLDTYQTAEEAGLTKNDAVVFTTLRELTKTMLDRVNIVREQVGLKPIRTIKSYVTHISDAIAKKELGEKYPFPEELRYWLDFINPKHIYNPTALKRMVESRPGLLKDPIKALKAMVAVDLKQIYLEQPNLFFKEQMEVFKDIMPASTKQWVQAYMSEVIKGMPTRLDNLSNATLNSLGITKMIDWALKPFGRTLSHNPIKDMTGMVGRLVHDATIWGKVKLVIRNHTQKNLTLGLYDTKAFIKGTLPASREMETLIQASEFHKISKQQFMEQLPESIFGKIEKIGYKPYGHSHISNVNFSMKVAYHAAKELVDKPKYKHLGWTEADIIKEMDYGAMTTQYWYNLMGMPEIYRSGITRSFAVLQSWWQNYAFNYWRELLSRAWFGKTGWGKPIPLKWRLGALRHIITSIVFIEGMRRAFGLDYKRIALLGTLPAYLSPPGQIILGLFQYAVAKDDKQRKRAISRLKWSWKAFVPGSGAWKDFSKVWKGEMTTKEFLFYTEKQKKGTSFTTGTVPQGTTKFLIKKDTSNKLGVGTTKFLIKK